VTARARSTGSRLERTRRREARTEIVAIFIPHGRRKRFHRRYALAQEGWAVPLALAPESGREAGARNEGEPYVDPRPGPENVSQVRQV
jgi:hypothetical protein